MSFPVQIAAKFIAMLLLHCALFTTPLCAQLPTAFIRTYGGDQYEDGKQIISCITGGYLIVGTTGSDVANQSNVYLLKIDEQLNCVWSKSIGGNGIDVGNSLVQDDEGNIFVCGYTSLGQQGGYDVLVVKLTAEGNQIWSKTYGGADWDFGHKMIHHPVEGFLVCGKSYSDDFGGEDGYLLHIDSDGTVMSEMMIGQGGDDSFEDIEVYQNQILLAGYSQQETKRAWLLSVGLSGEILLNRYYGDDFQSMATSVDLLDDSILFTYQFFTNEEQWDNSQLLILDYEGNILHQPLADFGIAQSDQVKTQDYILGIGRTNNYGSGNYAASIMRRDLLGGWLISPAFGSVQDEFPYSIIHTADNQVLVVGAGNSYNSSGEFDVYVVKFNNDSIENEYQLNILHQACFTVGLEELTINTNGIYYELNEFLTSDFGPYSVQLYDLSGRLINQFESASFQIEILREISLKNGLFLLEIKTPSSVFSGKLILAR